MKELLLPCYLQIPARLKHFTRQNVVETETLIWVIRGHAASKYNIAGSKHGLYYLDFHSVINFISTAAPEVSEGRQQQRGGLPECNECGMITTFQDN